MGAKMYRVSGWIIVLGAVLAMASLMGCRADAPIFVEGAYQPVPPAGIDFGEFNQVPPPRLGCLPWPGPFTVFETADPLRLGEHCYDHGPHEKERGIIYTCRGGFIDVSHLRKTIDLCKYAQVRMEFALLNDWTALQIKSLEPTVYVIRLNYPPDWKKLAPAEKKALAHELSI